MSSKQTPDSPVKANKRLANILSWPNAMTSKKRNERKKKTRSEG
jgi:hypothetical protein